jgi:hypothetical protein
MDVKRMTHAAVYGSRGKLVDKIQEPLARRTPSVGGRDQRSLRRPLPLLVSATNQRAIRAGFGD